MQENAAMNAEFDKHEGCNVNGWIEVQRVAGNFHLSVHADHYFAMRSVGVMSSCSETGLMLKKPEWQLQH